jgi:hypothetical protein
MNHRQSEKAESRTMKIQDIFNGTIYVHLRGVVEEELMMMRVLMHEVEDNYFPFIRTTELLLLKEETIGSSNCKSVACGDRAIALHRAFIPESSDSLPTSFFCS